MRLIEIRKKPVYESDYIPEHKKCYRNSKFGAELLEFLDSRYMYSYIPNSKLFRGMWYDIGMLIGRIVKNSGVYDPVISVNGKGLVMLNRFYRMMLESDSVTLTVMGCEPSNDLCGCTISMETYNAISYEEFQEFVEFLLTKFPQGIPDDYFTRGSTYIFKDSINQHGFTVNNGTGYEFITLDFNNNEPPQTHLKYKMLEFKLRGTLKYQGDYGIISDDLYFENESGKTL